MRNVIEVDVDRNQIVFVGNTYDGSECESCINFIVSDDIVVIIAKDGVEQSQEVAAVDGNACYILDDALLRSEGEFTVTADGIDPMRFVVDRDIPEGKTFSIRLSTNGSLCVRCAEASSSGGTAGAASWYDITDKPSTFPPTEHAHPLNMELIWENADISSDFAGQRITIANKSEFQLFVLMLQSSGTELQPGNCVTVIISNGYSNVALGIVGSKLVRRLIRASAADNIQFGTGYSFDEYGTSLVENTGVMKPVYLYGIK